MILLIQPLLTRHLDWDVENHLMTFLTVKKLLHKKNNDCSSGMNIKMSKLRWTLLNNKCSKTPTSSGLCLCLKTLIKSPWPGGATSGFNKVYISRKISQNTIRMIRVDHSHRKEMLMLHIEN